MAGFDIPAIGVTTLESAEYLLYPKSIVIQFLRECFAQSDLLTKTNGEGGNPFLFVGGEDGIAEKETKLLIVPEWHDEFEQENFRPGIVVTRSDVGLTSMNTLNRGKVGVRSKNAKFDTQIFQKQSRGTIALRCITRDPNDSELLAGICAILISSLHEQIRKRTKLFKIEEPVVQPVDVARVRGGKSMMCIVGVVFDFWQTLRWNIRTTKVVNISDSLVLLEEDGSEVDFDDDPDADSDTGSTESS